MEILCRQSDAAKKIEEIATGIHVTVSNTLTKNQVAPLIANTILFEPKVVQLVARFNGNNLEMEKDWELMSELDKDELLDKKIVILERWTSIKS